MTDQTVANNNPVSSVPGVNNQSSQIVVNSSLPSIKQLFSQSWTTFTRSFGGLISVNVFSFLSSIGLLIIAGLLAFSFGVIPALIKAFSNFNPNKPTIPNISSSVWVNLGLIFIFYIIAQVIINFVVQIASIMVVADEQPSSLKDKITKSFGLIIPYFAVVLLTSFFIYGGFFVLFIPAIFIAIFLSYSIYEAILGGKKKLEALKSSAQIISQHLGGIIIRNLIYLLFVILLAIIIPNIISKIDKNIGSIISSIWSFFTNWLLGWFGIAFSITLYKQAKAATDTNKKTSITWMWVLAILGWLIAVCIGYGGYKLTVKAWKAGLIQKAIQEEIMRPKQNIKQPLEQLKTI